MKNRTESVSARVSYETKKELDRIAAEEQRTLSQVIALVIEEGLKAWKARRGQRAKPKSGKPVKPQA